MDERAEHMHDDLVAYALGHLDDAARARVVEALDADPTLRAELDSIEATGALLLAGGIERHRAPPALRSRVMDSVLAGADRGSVSYLPRTAPELDARASQGQVGWRGRRWWHAATAGLAAACVALAAVAMGLRQDLDAAQERASRLATPAPAEQGATRPVGFEDATSHTVEMTGGFEQARGSLIRVADEQWILLLRDIPSPGPGESWQVWTADEDGDIENIARWADGASSRVILIDDDDIVEVMVSHETTTESIPTPVGATVADVKV